jgi:hypothetical protein
MWGMWFLKLTKKNPWSDLKFLQKFKFLSVEICIIQILKAGFRALLKAGKFAPLAVCAI